MELFRNRRRLLMVFAICAVVVIGATVLLWPSVPKKPSIIPLGDYSYTIEYVDYQINTLMKKYNLPSVVVALIDDQNVIHEQAYGTADLEKQLPATLDTIYKLGSITKVFTGIEVMRMYEEGLIDLDAPITDYIPEFSINSRFSSSEPITIRSLLAHRSGLPRNDTLLEWYWESWPDVLEAKTDSLTNAYQAFPVGYRYKYSNIGYNVLGRLIEVIRGIEPPDPRAVSGWPYYMRDQILMPMEMNDTAFGSDQLLYGTNSELDTAMGYYYEDGKNKPYNQFDIIRLASGNMQSTMHDMVKFVQYLLLEAGDSGEGLIIEGDTLCSMFEKQYTRPRDPQTNGLTWFTDREQLDELIVFHSGTSQGVISLVALMPERDLGLVVFSNSDSFEDEQNQLMVDIFKLMLETKHGIVPSEKSAPDQVRVDKSTIERYVGKYAMNGEILEIILSGDTSKVVYQGQQVRMIPISQSRFMLSHWLTDVEDFQIEFFVDDADEEDIMILTAGGSFHIVCPKYPEISEAPPLWQKLIGEYDIYPRIPSVYSDSEILGADSIQAEENVLSTSSGKLLLPIDETEIIIVGGINDGETMIYDDKTGSITWQNMILKPAEPSE
jgi:CubicO group peptidase (beta-lactamase class C family)